MSPAVKLRVVQVDQRKVIQPESLPALLHRHADPLAGVVAIAGVDLRCDDEAGRQAPESGDPGTDTPLALASAVAVGGVEEADRTGQRRFHQIDRIRGRDVVPEVVRHAPEWAPAEADR